MKLVKLLEIYLTTLNLTNTDFIRTTEDRHKNFSSTFMERIREK